MTLEISNTEEKLNVWFENPRQLWMRFPKTNPKDYWELTVRPALTCHKIHLIKAVVALADALMEPDHPWRGWLVMPSGALDMEGKYLEQLLDVIEKHETIFPTTYTFVLQGPYAREIAYATATILTQAERPKPRRLPDVSELRDRLPSIKNSEELMPFLDLLEKISKTGELGYKRLGPYRKLVKKERLERARRNWKRRLLLRKKKQGDLTC